MRFYVLQFVCVKKNSIVDAVACMEDKSHQFWLWLSVCRAKKIGWCSNSPGRVRQTRLATSRVMHMKAMSNTIWKKRDDTRFEKKTSSSAILFLTFPLYFILTVLFTFNLFTLYIFYIFFSLSGRRAFLTLKGKRRGLW